MGAVPPSLERAFLGDYSAAICRPHADTQLPLTLLTLPAEIRNTIYRFVVVEGVIADTPRSMAAKGRRRDDRITTFTFCANKTPTQHIWRVSPPEPASTATCKQVQEEALPIYYAENVFELIGIGNAPGIGNVPLDVVHERLQHWRKFLGKYAAMLAHLQSRYVYNFSVYGHPHWKTYELKLVVRIDLTPEGTLIAQRFVEGGRTLHCSCDLHLRLANHEYAAKDGNQLIDILEDCANDARSGGEIKVCRRCGLPALATLLRSFALNGEDGLGN